MIFFTWSKRLRPFAYAITFSLWIPLYFSLIDVILLQNFLSKLPNGVHDFALAMVRFFPRIFHRLPHALLGWSA